ncbi:MAG: HAD-IIB family hydrolase [Candidatus Bathyarchaeota archaeon]|nr:HAD-IIB family hydrolase [Candidatus Bathyarchaeota archaeon]
MKDRTTKIVIFADLDGTLLNEKYDHTKVQPIIRQLISLNVSIVLASSKTRLETDFYRREFKIHDPFIVENGSAIVIPDEYFQTNYTNVKRFQSYYIIEFGSTYSIIREKLALVKKRTGANIVGFGDMTVEEIAKDSNLPKFLAEFAKKREYDEPFKIIEGNEEEVLRAINDLGFSYTKGGRYFHMLGNTDKGKAVALLKNLYEQKFERVVTFGVGDSDNDLSMLEIVGEPFYLGENKAEPRIWQNILAKITEFLAKEEG